MFSDDLLDSIPLGKAPLLLLVIALVSGAWLLFHPVENPDSNVEVWTFVFSNAETYAELGDEFESKVPEARVEVQNIQYFALQNRLRSAFWADLEVPDVVELEISYAGGFFRGPTEDIGFLDLDPFMRRDGVYDRIVMNRLAPYQNRGHQYGLPNDIHPVMIAYRRDLFEEYGIDAETLKTWDDFIEAGRKVSADGRRFMLQLADSNANHFEVFFFQNNGGYFDAEGKLTMDNEVALQTLRWYIPLVAGPDRIGNDLGSDQVFTQAIEDGYFLCILAPDWLAHHIKQVCPRVEGRMALMPLPVFHEGGRRTSTMGGTMIGITRDCEDPELAWQFIKHVRLDPEGMADRFREHGVVPPFRDAWQLPEFQEPDRYWSDQPTGALYASVADEVPPRYASPYISLAKAKLGEAVSASAAYYRANGEKGFDEFTERRLRQAADEVRRAMTRNPFQ